MSRTATEPDIRMGRGEYRTWAQQQPSGRFERVNGIVVAMAPERVEHNARKMPLGWPCARPCRHAGLPCAVYTDGMTVEVGDSDYEPDVIVYCGKKLPGNAVAVPDPLAIVEVLSPSTSSIDRAWKLKEYFRLPSLRHYLIVWADKAQVTHHRRDDTGEIETRTIVGGTITLDPPGIAIAVDDIYAE